MKKIFKKLADHRALVPVVVFFICANSFSIQSEKIGFYTTKSGSLGLLKNGSIDILYIRDSSQFRQFTTNEFTYTFLQKDLGERTLILGQRLSKDRKAMNFSLFLYENLTRFNSDNERLIPICTGAASFSRYKLLSKSLQELVSKVDNQTIENCFDKKTCGNELPIEEAADAIRISLKATENRFRKCLFENKNGEVEKKLSTNDQFSRIMFTYLVNLEAFTKSVLSNKQVLELKCSENPIAMLEKSLTNRSAVNEVTKFSISLPNSLIKGLKSDSEKIVPLFTSQFNKIITHEIDHVFFNIPTVTNANSCEHEYQTFIATACPALESQITSKLEVIPDQPIPKCVIGSKPSFRLANKNSSNKSEGTAAEQAAILQAISTATPREDSPTQLEGTGRNKELGAVAARADQTAEAAVRATAGPSDSATTPKVRQQLTGGEEVTVRQVADSVFGPAQSGNTQIQEYANQIFTNTNAQRQQQLAEQITAKLDSQLDSFSKSTVALQGAVALQSAMGTTAVAATLTGSSLNPTTLARSIANSNSGGGAPVQAASAVGWTPQQAFNSYITGNPGSADGAATTVKLAGKLTNSGGTVSAMATAGGSGRATTVPSNSASTSGGQVISGKMGVTNLSQGSASPADATVPNQTAYQLDGQTSGVRDTPTLRMLSSSATTISGNYYNAITKDYKSDAFVKGLKDRHISIRVVDPKTGRLRTTYGIQALPDGQVRQPSSIGSGPNAKKLSPPDIIFEDNGTSLRKK